MVKLAIIGTGGMANHQASLFKDAGADIVACCDIDAKRAAAFAEKRGIPASFDDTGKLYAKAAFDAVSIVTPDASHCPLALEAIGHGKHVMSEKPLAVNYEDACKMRDAALAAGVINMVNFSYRDSWSIQEAARRIAAGEIGELRHVEGNYLQSWLTSNGWGDWKTTPTWLWRLSSKHGSKGCLGDVGVHILDFVTYPAGPVKRLNCLLKTFDKAPGNKISEYEFDANDSAIISVEFASGAIGTIHTTRYATGYQNRVAASFYGTEGAIEIDLDKSNRHIRICHGDGVNLAAWEEILCPETPSNYQRFLTGIETGKQEQADFARGAEVQNLLDACFDSDESGTFVSTI